MTAAGFTEGCTEGASLGKTLFQNAWIVLGLVSVGFDSVMPGRFGLLWVGSKSLY